MPQTPGGQRRLKAEILKTWLKGARGAEREEIRAMADLPLEQWQRIFSLSPLGDSAKEAPLERRAPMCDGPRHWVESFESHDQEPRSMYEITREEFRGGLTRGRCKLAKSMRKRDIRHQGRRADQAPAKVPGARAASVPSLFPEITHRKKLGFLTAFVQCGNRSKSAATVGVSARLHYYWLETDPVDAEAFARAERLCAQMIEDAIWERGVEGVDEPVFWEGKKVGTRRRVSDTRLIFAAKGAISKYRDRTNITHDLSPAMAALLAEWDASATRQAADAPEPPPSTEAEWAPMLPGESFEPDNPEGYVPHGPRAPEGDAPSMPAGPPPGMSWPPPEDTR